MPETLRLVLAALACYRLAQLVAIDEGPGEMFLRLRAALGAYEYREDGQPATSWGRLISCPYCLGMYLALPGAALVVWHHIIGDIFLLVLGLAGAQAWLQGAREA